MYVFLNAVIALLLSLSFLGCTAVFNTIKTSMVEEKLTLTANCSDKAPVNLSYYCEPSIDYTPPPSSSLKFSYTPTFQLINNTCSKLSINSSTGVINGTTAMLELSSSCSYQVQVTQGSKTQASESITVTGSNAITYSFSKPTLSVKKGGSVQKVSVEFSESLPFKTNIEYEFYSSKELIPFLYFNPTDTITVSDGATKVDLSFSIPSSSSFISTGYYGLILKNLTPEPGHVSLDLRAYETKKSFEVVSAGGNHTCGIDNGALYCWGWDAYGQLGNGSGLTENIESPQQIGTSTSWSTVSAGTYHTCGIDAGTLYCWGRDTNGQIGNGSGSTANIESPQQIGVSTSWSDISANYAHTCGIDNGALYCWGWDAYGQVGNGSGSTVNVETPQQVGVSSAWDVVSTGRYNTCAISTGALSCFGGDTFGQMGNGSGSTGNIEDPQQLGVSTLWTAVSIGSTHTCGIDNGALYCWGRDTDGQIGNGSVSTGNIETPAQVGTSTDWTAVSSGENHTCGVDNGVLYCWGRDSDNQIGNGSESTVDVDSPQQIGSSTSWSAVSSGVGHTCGFNNGALYCWGRDSYGQVGDGNGSLAFLEDPQQIGNSTNWSSAITSGADHTCGIDNGALYCWGSNLNGKSGIGSTSSADIEVPQRVGISTSWSAVSAGTYHTCGINNGALYCWGSDIYGQLGNGGSSTSSVIVPQQIGTSTSWSSVSSGQYHTCGINNGALYCWGGDYDGEIGNGSGSTGIIESPQQIGSSTSWSVVSTGGNHTCGVDNGALYCWGSDGGGQIGNGSSTTASIETPQQIGVSTTWSTVSAGGTHNCGIDNGALYCWGEDNSGQIGNGSGSLADVEAPQQIGSSTSWDIISAGSYYTCGIDNNELYCWGEDVYGQLGNGSASTANIETPQKIGTSNTWTTVSAGRNNTCAVLEGTLKCFGNNDHIQSSYKSLTSIPTEVLE